MKESTTKTPAPAVVKSVPKMQYQQVSTAPPPASVTENVVADSHMAEDGDNQDGEGIC